MNNDYFGVKYPTELFEILQTDIRGKIPHKILPQVLPLKFWGKILFWGKNFADFCQVFLG